MGQESKIAILIDAENISSKYIKLIMDEVSEFGIATYKRLYGDFASSSTQSWLNHMQEYAINPVYQQNYTQGKNASDSALIIDAMDILYSGHVEGFCIVSSDSDFTKLAMRLRESGMKVIGMGEQKTPTSFVSACETFRFLDLLYKNEYEKGSSEKTDKDKNNAAKKNGIKEIVVEEVETLSPIPKKEEIEKEVVSIIEKNADTDGWLNLAEVGNNLIKRVPGFDPRNYKCMKLGQLIEGFQSLEIKTTRNQHNSFVNIVYVRIKKDLVKKPVKK